MRADEPERGVEVTVPRWSGLREDLAAVHAAALAAADPAAAVSRVLAEDPAGLRVGGELVAMSAGARLWVVAAGKAARGMAGAALEALGGRVAGGLVAHPRGAPRSPREPRDWPAPFRVLAAAHPLPDQASLEAGDVAARLAAGAAAGDVLLVLLSGGASALLESPRAGVTLESVRAATSALQRAGADVAELNTVRRCLSRLKGGGLARLAAPARTVTLAISDVLGDRPEAIGSGPTVTSPTRPADALAVLARHDLADALPEITAALETADELDAVPEGLYRVVASNRAAAEAAAEAARQRGFAALVVTTFVQGEAREAGRMVGGCAASVRAHGLPLAPPACLVFGGETTVTVRGAGRGGRNLELALGAAVALDGVERAAVLAFATDGVDGASSAAGAVATGETLRRAAALGRSPHDALADSDSEPFFRALGDLWESGPTGTNVNDVAVALVYA